MFIVPHLRLNANDRAALSRKQVKNYVFGECKSDIDHDGQLEDIQFVLVYGTLIKYDVAAGALIEYGFDGNMGLQVKKVGKIISQNYPLPPRNRKTLTLPGGDHQLACGDLNNDGNIDFPLRVDWSSRSDYKIYSVSATGEISELPIKNKQGYFPLVDDTQALSTKKIFQIYSVLQVNNAKFNSFLAAKSTTYHEVPWTPYQWDGAAFVPLSTAINGCKSAASCSKTRKTFDEIKPKYIVSLSMQGKISSDALKISLDVATQLLMERLVNSSSVYAFKIDSVELLTTKKDGAPETDSFYDDYERMSAAAYRVQYTYSLFPNSGQDSFVDCRAGDGTEHKVMGAYIDKKDGNYRIVGWGNG